MKAQLRTLSKTAAWISLSLGVIHSIATVVVAPSAISLGKEWFGTFIFMYVSTGIACLLAGGGMLLSTSKAIEGTRTSNQLFLISALFMLVLGIGAPIAMSDNPFGYISLLLGVFAISIALLRFREH